MKWIKENSITLLFVIFLTMAFYHIVAGIRGDQRKFENLIGQKQEIEFLNDKIANLTREYITEMELHKASRKEFGDTIDQLKGRIKVLSNATFLIREKARESSQSDIVYRGNRLKYIVNEIRYNDGPPIGYILIFDDGRVVSKIYNHEIDVKTLVARDESTGKYDVVTRADFVLKSPAITNGWLNKPYGLKIKGGTALIDPTEPISANKTFHLWAPNINAGMNFTGKDVLPSIGFSTSGYGYSERDLDFKFLNIGTQYSNEDGLGLNLIPVLYRPFEDVLRNTYFGPGIQIDSNGQSFYIGLQIGL